jgi:hypothetical protein
MSRRIDAVIKILKTFVITCPLNACRKSRPTFQARTIQACIAPCKIVKGKCICSIPTGHVWTETPKRLHHEENKMRLLLIF